MAEQNHPLIPLNLVASAGFRSDFNALFKLNVAQMKLLADACNTEKGFDVAERKIESLSKELDVSINDIIQIIRVTKFLYEHARDIGLNVSEAVKTIFEFAVNTKIEGCEEKEEGIRYLLEPKNEYDRKESIKEASKAIIPTVENIAVECDVRPVYDNKNLKISGYIPMILMEIRLEKETGKNLQFQITEEEFEEITKKFQKVKDLLRNIREDLKGKIINI